MNSQDNPYVLVLSPEDFSTIYECFIASAQPSIQAALQDANSRHTCAEEDAEGFETTQHCYLENSVKVKLF